MADAYCVWLYWGDAFFCFKGDGPAKPFRENVSPEDIRDGKSLTCSTWKRRSQTLCHLEWILRLARKHTWIFIRLLCCRKKVPIRAPWPNQPRVWKPSSWALGMSTKPDCDQPEGTSSQKILNNSKAKFVSSTARDFLLDSHVTFCWLGGQN